MLDEKTENKKYAIRVERCSSSTKELPPPRESRADVLFRTGSDPTLDPLGAAHGVGPMNLNPQPTALSQLRSKSHSHFEVNLGTTVLGPQFSSKRHLR